MLQFSGTFCQGFMELCAPPVVQLDHAENHWSKTFRQPDWHVNCSSACNEFTVNRFSSGMGRYYVCLIQSTSDGGWSKTSGMDVWWKTHVIHTHTNVINASLVKKKLFAFRKIQARRSVLYLRLQNWLPVTGKRQPARIKFHYVGKGSLCITSDMSMFDPLTKPKHSSIYGRVASQQRCVSCWAAASKRGLSPKRATARRPFVENLNPR